MQVLFGDNSSVAYYAHVLLLWDTMYMYLCTMQHRYYILDRRSYLRFDYSKLFYTL
jgi:hypothetical protein